MNQRINMYKKLKIPQFVRCLTNKALSMSCPIDSLFECNFYKDICGMVSPGEEVLNWTRWVPDLSTEEHFIYVDSYMGESGKQAG